jgi:hypothetical protein
MRQCGASGISIIAAAHDRPTPKPTSITRDPGATRPRARVFQGNRYRRRHRVAAILETPAEALGGIRSLLRR